MREKTDYIADYADDRDRTETANVTGMRLCPESGPAGIIRSRSREGRQSENLP